ncbi:MAG: hypothetical protein GX950_01325 [Candidatus Diapherotrites archaeon]|uniref:Uncharacterized protein n=1 Tax=Candidatus Iainarchaeum sp. TaxID=3101447 RepID=A0A7K4BYY7_9ARCH|nr:hypothetical protein [Candidatus Diapherotrites archaeon]
MAFKNLVEGTRKMNEKMIAMGQSIDIQKMPRPKGNTTYKSSPAMMAAGASEVELMLYPKNFKSTPINKTEELNNSTREMIENIKEQEERKKK